MGLEKVLEEILATGEEQRRKILADAAAQKEKLISTAKADTEKVARDREQAARNRAVMLKQQSMSSAELEAKKRMLYEQNLILAEAKRDALDALSSMDAERKRDLLTKLSRIAAKQMQKGTIHCRKEDERMVSAPAGFKKVCDLHSVGGLIAESEDGAYRFDMTFEVLLEDVWNKRVQEIYSTLFGGA